MTDPNADLIGGDAADSTACVMCGASGASDLGDGAVLCRACSGENALAEAAQERLQ